MTNTLSGPTAGLLTARQVAEHIQRPERTLERWRLTGEGPPFVRLGRRVAYRTEDVQRWVAGRTYASRAAELAQSTKSGRGRP